MERFWTAAMTFWWPSPAKVEASAPRAARGAWQRRRHTSLSTSSPACRCACLCCQCRNGCGISCPVLRRAGTPSNPVGCGAGTGRRPNRGHGRGQGKARARRCDRSLGCHGLGERCRCAHGLRAHWGVARCTAHADGVAHGVRLVEAHALGLIASALAQLLPVRWSQRGQTGVAGVTVLVKSKPKQVHDGRAADILMGPVHLHQQRHIGAGVFASKRPSRHCVRFGQGGRGQAVGMPARNQPGELLAAVAAGVAQVAQQHAFVGLRKARIVKAFKDSADYSGMITAKWLE